MNVHLLDVLGPGLGLLRGGLFSLEFILLLFLGHKCDLWVWLWLLLLGVGLGAVLQVGAGIDAGIERLSPDVITRTGLFQNSGLGCGTEQCKDCQRNILHF